MSKRKWERSHHRNHTLDLMAAEGSTYGGGWVRPKVWSRRAARLRVSPTGVVLRKKES